MQQRAEPEMQSEEQAMVERWQDRQQQLGDLLERYEAAGCERRLDWIDGHIRWVNERGDTLATGVMRALCSFSQVDAALMMAWANSDPEEAAVIEPQPDVPDLIEDCAEGDAWLWAMSLADAVEADYLYRVAGDDHLVFLGVWDVHDPLSRKRAEPGSAPAFVIDLLDGLNKALQEEERAADLRRRFVNHGESLRQNAGYLESHGADSYLLQRTAETLVEMGESFGQRRFGVLPPPPLPEAANDALRRRLFGLRRDWLRTGIKNERE